MSNFELHHGNCLDVLRTMPDNSVDSVVTDPPYGLSFMGKKWDYDVPATEVWAECLRVLKPGGHLLAFAGTRTQHRMACRIEDAGFEIRDMIAWVYGSGFPKSLDVSKAIDKAAGAKRKVIGPTVRCDGRIPQTEAGNKPSNGYGGGFNDVRLDTQPATDAAAQWQGWGTAMKPALEPITVARKPLVGTVASNVMAWGTGGLNIDACRVASENEKNPSIERRAAAGISGKCGSGLNSSQRKKEGLPGFNKDIANYVAGNPGEALGRWPANLIHDGSPEVLAGFPHSASNSGNLTHKAGVQGVAFGKYGEHPTKGITDAGSSARFFYCAKASPADRNEGLDDFEEKLFGMSGGAASAADQGKDYENGDSGVNRVTLRKNIHPTVKPTDLMAHLCRLVTPPGGIVLDPFMGSGSTGKAAMREGFRFIGCELSAEYLAIARARIEHELARAAHEKTTAYTSDLFAEAE